VSDSDVEARIAALERKVSDLYRALNRREPGGPAAAATDSGVTDVAAADEDPWVIELVTAGRKVEAVKAYRESAGVGLKEAKRAVDRLEALYRPGG
jgi:ribosomal protein L7/L12